MNPDDQAASEAYWQQQEQQQQELDKTMELIKTIDNFYKFDIYYTTKTTPKLSNDGESIIGEYVEDQFWVYINDKKDTVHHALKEAEQYIRKEYHEE